MTTIRMLPNWKQDLTYDPTVAQQLRLIAGDVASRVDAPSRMTITTRAGVGPRGAFAQVQMFGPGALTVEFGNRSRPPLAPLRRALGTF